MAVQNADRDRLHKERVDAFMKKFHSDAEVDEDLFVSERVDSTVFEPKAFLSSYNLDRIIALLPYHETVYATICPKCISNDDVGKFRTLVERGAIIPALTGPYQSYDDEIVDIIYGRDHINRYEYAAFRYISIMADHSNIVCRHCVGEWEKSAKRVISRRANLLPFKSSTERLLRNLHPYVAPDYELLDEFLDALKRKNKDELEQIAEMSEVVYAARSAQAFKAPLDLNDTHLSELPAGISADLDQAIAVSNRIELDVAKGLGLKVPVDVKLEEYIDIVRDFRPEIVSAVHKLTALADDDGDRNKYAAEIQKNIIKVNSEVERLKHSRRHMLLEAALEIHGKNSALVNAALVAGAFGLVGGIAGCVGGPVVASGVGALASGVGTVIKRANVIKTGSQSQRFAERLERDLQPFFNRFLELYVGASATAVSVLSIRKGIDRRVQAAARP